MAGGVVNTASGANATVPGGGNNHASGDGSFAATGYVQATHAGAIVFADGYTGTSFASAADGEFAVRASGGIRLRTDAGATTGCNLAGSGSWTCTSDRNAKTDFTPVDGQAVLAKVAAMPVETWRYKGEAEGVRHMGPMAQDFHAAFGLNGDDDKGIGATDIQGVALAAIQGLHGLVQEQRALIESQRADLAAQQAEIAALKASYSRVSERIQRIEARSFLSQR